MRSLRLRHVPLAAGDATEQSASLAIDPNISEVIRVKFVFNR
jgi:hypothetical protein